MAHAVNILLCIVFEIDDSPAFILVEILLCFVATAAMRAGSHRHALPDWAGLSKIGVIAGGASPQSYACSSCF